MEEGREEGREEVEERGEGGGGGKRGVGGGKRWRRGGKKDVTPCKTHLPGRCLYSSIPQDVSKELTDDIHSPPLLLLVLPSALFPRRRHLQRVLPGALPGVH